MWPDSKPKWAGALSAVDTEASSRLAFRWYLWRAQLAFIFIGPHQSRPCIRTGYRRGLPPRTATGSRPPPRSRVGENEHSTDIGARLTFNVSVSVTHLQCECLNTRDRRRRGQRRFNDGEDIGGDSTTVECLFGRVLVLNAPPAGCVGVTTRRMLW
jgi:hypothetical protein